MIVNVPITVAKHAILVPEVKAKDDRAEAAISIAHHKARS